MDTTLWFGARVSNFIMVCDLLFFSGVFAHQNPGLLKDAGETAGKCRLLITVPKFCCDYHSCSCVFRDHSAWKQSLPEHSRGYLLIWPSMPLAGNSGSSCLRNELYRWVEIAIFFSPHAQPKLTSLTPAAEKSACGPERQIKVFAEQDDINLEYCDREGADKDCALLFDGRPVRHVRLDARVAVIDEIKHKEQTLAKTVSMKKFQKEEAPWFL